jgi:hypothetical protein
MQFLNWRVHRIVFPLTMGLLVFAGSTLSSLPETAHLAEVLRSGYPWFGGIYLVFISVLWVLWPDGTDERNNREG